MNVSYTKQNFTAGQKLTAAQMNHIENGIVALEQPKNSTTLIDRTSGKKYTLYVDNGKLKMEEVSE